MLRLAVNEDRGGAVKQSIQIFARPYREIGTSDSLIEPGETFTFDGDLGRSMNIQGRHGTAIAVTGDEGGGWTTSALILTAQLDAIGMRVKFLGLHEGACSC